MAEQPEPKNGIQLLFLNLFASSDKRRAAMEEESRSWMIQCPHCGYQRSVWDAGGIRYKAAGISRQFRECPSCGRKAWHRVYKSTGTLPLGVAPLSTGMTRFPRLLLWGFSIGLLISVIVAFVAILLLVLSSLTQPVVTAGDAFMADLKNGDYSLVYALCTPELQQELGDVPGVTALVQGYQPAQWNWINRSVRNGVGFLDGSLTYTSSKKGKVHLVLHQVSNEWRISNFRMIPDNP